MSRWLRAVPVYPALLAAAFVITRYLQSIESLPVLVRPLLVVVGAVLVIQLVLTLVLRRTAIAGYLAAILPMLLLDPPVGFLLLLAGVIPVVSAARAKSRRVGPGDWAKLTAAVNIAALVVFALNVAPLVSRETARPAAGATGQANAALPDIYLLMLDGYPRADTLRNEFGYDNSLFLDSMADLGFEVAEQSHSNYNATLLTLTSMLNMRPAQELVTGPTTPHDSARQLTRSLNDAVGLDLLRSLGYRVLTIPSGVSGFTIYGADEVLDTGQINSFEITIERAGLLPLLLPGAQNSIVHGALRDRVTSSLDRLAEVAATPSERPRFVLAHVMSPHPPIVFDADGAPKEGWGCFPQGCDPWHDPFNLETRDATLAQLIHLNGLVHDSVQNLLESRAREAVVIVFSDHGRRHDLDNPAEMVRSLFMSSTPGRAGLFPDDTSPINILPRVLNAYAGQSLPLAAEDAWVLNPLRVPDTGYLDLTPWVPD